MAPSLVPSPRSGMLGWSVSSARRAGAAAEAAEGHPAFSIRFEHGFIFFYFFVQPNEQHEWNQAGLSWLKVWTVNLVCFFKKKKAEELSSAISGCRCHLQGLAGATRRFPILAKELPSSCRHPPEEDPDAAASVLQGMQDLYPITVVWSLLLYFWCWWLFSGLGKHLIPFICMPAFSVVWSA